MTPCDHARPFDIRGPLPTGTTLLEASAGTGKTWTIGALVTRYVAEGVARLERDARRDVRPRRQPGAARAGPRPAGRGRARAGRRRGARPTTPSDLIELLLRLRRRGATGRRHRRVVEALAAFDAATIATTHQFCSMVLGSLGVAGDTDARARLVEDLDELLAEVVDDLYLRAFAYARGRRRPSPTPRRWPSRATAVGDPQARLEPAGRRPRAPRPACGSRSPRRSAPSSSAASAGSAILSLRRPAQPARRRRSTTTPRPGRGCASAGGSCWSTSSRTPTRCSGRCSTGRSPATRRWS